MSHIHKIYTGLSMNKFYALSVVLLAGLVFCNAAMACPASKGSKGTHGTETEETGK